MEYLTIADFSQAVGVSKQAIYKRLSKDLAPYVIIRDGSKCLSTDALALFGAAVQVEREASPAPSSEHTLEDQLAAKDKQIAELQGIISDQLKQIATLQNSLIELTKSVADGLNQQNQLQLNYQVLLAQKTQQNQEVQQDSTGCSTVQPVNQPVGNQVEQPVESEKSGKPHKQGFFSRFFS